MALGLAMSFFNRKSHSIIFSLMLPGFIGIAMTLGCAKGGYAPGQCDINNRMTNAPYADGAGTATNPYLICTGTQLNQIGLRTQDWGANFQLMTNIDLSSYPGTQFNIIGTAGTPFTGVFNGDNLTISNFNYVNAGASNVGLFAAIQSATIKNLTLFDPVVTGSSDVGALIGQEFTGTPFSTISNISIAGSAALITSSGGTSGGIIGTLLGTLTQCSSQAQVNGGAGTSIGGLIGVTAGVSPVITNCSFFGSVTTTGGTLGGVLGSGFGTMSNLTTTGTVNCGGGGNCGGIIGNVNSLSTIINSYSTANISNCSSDCGGLIGSAINIGITSSYVLASVSGSGDTGGLVGSITSSSIASSYFSGSVAGTGFGNGGLVGLSQTNSSIYTSYSLGSVTTSGAGRYTGGLVGEVLGVASGNGIYNSYSQSSVTSSTVDTGGLVGYVVGGSSLDIQNSYASGLVTEAGGNKGGITGLDNGTGIYVNCFFDSTVNPTLFGIGGSASAQLTQNGVNVFGDATTSMQTATTFSLAGWSITIWNLVNGSYQSLAWQ
jgi:hypothetical protein